MEGYGDIGARHYFGQADFFMPELLPKEVCSGASPAPGVTGSPSKGTVRGGSVKIFM